MHFIEMDDSCITDIINEPAKIIWTDKTGARHAVSLESCAVNFALEHKNASPNCIGERKMDEWFFILYTGDEKTKIVFRRFWGFCRPLTGTRKKRFRALQNWIIKLNYKTYDIS